MAKKKTSILKKQRQEKRKRIRNKRIKSKIKTLIKKVKSSFLKNDPNASIYLKEAYKQIDKAAIKGIIHKNTAARKKSRLMKFVNKFVTHPSK